MICLGTVNISVLTKTVLQGKKGKGNTNVLTKPVPAGYVRSTGMVSINAQTKTV